MDFYAYKAMKEVAEADGTIGAASIVVRKGLKQNTEDVSGDNTAYKLNWTQNVGDWQVKCFGNEEGKAMKTIWTSNNFAYSIVIRGQGSETETYGVNGETVEMLVNAIQ